MDDNATFPGLVWGSGCRAQGCSVQGPHTSHLSSVFKGEDLGKGFAIRQTKPRPRSGCVIFGTCDFEVITSLNTVDFPLTRTQTTGTLQQPAKISKK